MATDPSHRVSHRLHSIAGDSQLWKSAYYNRFVRPRASRIPGIRDEASLADRLHFSSKASRWLHDETLVQRGSETDWKRQYKLRHNWARGSCDVQEIEVAEQAPIPPLLVQLHEGIAVTVSASEGLCAWSVTGEQNLVAASPLTLDGLPPPLVPRPTSLAIDSPSAADARRLTVVVGFDDGRFSLYEREGDEATFRPRYTHAPSSNGMISAMAFSSPYLLTLTEGRLLSLYTFTISSESGKDRPVLDPPRLLSSLKSHTVWPPLTSSLRVNSGVIVASIAYALPTYLSGWSVGLQELRIAADGAIMDSRLASAVSAGFTPLSPALSPSSSPAYAPSPPDRSAGPVSKLALTKPTSLSYTHPYLLASHPDNTLTLYLVTSTSSQLVVSSGRRLWGHTSSVSGAHVGGRGKAVSVSSRGDELRVWELEGGIRTAASRRRWPAGEMSVQVRVERREATGASRASRAKSSAADGLEVVSPQGLAAALGKGLGEVRVTRGWVGFDEEKVVVLREKARGRQALFVYDFT
ncbi:MAG: hypothetical protein M1838_005673 [Thelocarpon superellum]|nr:MAG: hypothetical protein M1838_005673 [Thelocarpon superellum]